jgi:hypothetical protein
MESSMRRKAPPAVTTLPERQLRTETVDAILQSPGTTPLDIMTNTMRLLYNGAQNAMAQYANAEGVEREYLLDVARKYSLDACTLAKEIAPYIHRKQPIAVESRDLTDEDKQRMARTVSEVEKVLSAHQRLKRLEPVVSKH